MPTWLAYRSPSRPRPGSPVQSSLAAWAPPRGRRWLRPRRDRAALASSNRRSTQGRRGRRRTPPLLGDQPPLGPAARNSVGSERRRTASRTSAQLPALSTRVSRRARLSSTRATETSMHWRSGLGRRLAPQAMSATARRRHGGSPHAVVAPRQVESPRPRTSTPGMNQPSVTRPCLEKVLRRACPTLTRVTVRG